MRQIQNPFDVPVKLPDGEYVALCWYPRPKDPPRLIAANGKVVLFETVAMARQFIPQLGAGRIPRWSRDGETCTFFPLDPRGINQVAIVTGYTPHNLPAGAPVRSEVKNKPWKSHVMWFHAFYDTGRPGKPGNIITRADGSLENLALTGTN